MKLVSKLAPAGLALALSGCGLPPIVSAVSYAIEGASYAASGKSMTDHALSAAASQDCAMFRIVRGDPVCRTEDTGGTVVLAMAEPASTAGERSGAASPQGPTIYSYDIPRNAGWAIAAGADMSTRTAGSAPATGGSADLIRPETAVFSAPGPNVAIAPEDRVEAGADPGEAEIFALVQDDGALELFAYSASAAENGGRLVLVARIAGYADDPSVFAGISRDGRFVGVEELIV